MGLGKGRVGWSERPVDLVRGDMQKEESPIVGGVPVVLRMGPSGLEEPERADHIGPG